MTGQERDLIDSSTRSRPLTGQSDRLSVKALQILNDPTANDDNISVLSLNETYLNLEDLCAENIAVPVRRTPFQSQQTPAVRPELPVVRPELPAIRQPLPAVRPELPAVRPETTALRSETPTVRPETPAAPSASLIGLNLTLSPHNIFEEERENYQPNSSVCCIPRATQGFVKSKKAIPNSTNGQPKLKSRFILRKTADARHQLVADNNKVHPTIEQVEESDLISVPPPTTTLSQRPRASSSPVVLNQNFSSTQPRLSIAGKFRKILADLHQTPATTQPRPSIGGKFKRAVTDFIYNKMATSPNPSTSADSRRTGGSRVSVIGVDRAKNAMTKLIDDEQTRDKMEKALKANPAAVVRILERA